MKDGKNDKDFDRDSSRTFNYSNEEVQKMFKRNNNENSYENSPTIRPLLETDIFSGTLLDSYYKF